MYEDIELGLLDRGSRVSSTTSSTETLFDRSKVHSGYGASRLPVKPSVGTGIAAGQQYQKIFETQLGNAASDVNNPVGDFLGRLFYPDAYAKEDARRAETNRKIAEYYEKKRLAERKPDHLNWNKETRKRYPVHWKEFRDQRNATRKAEEEKKAGLVLPFSNNIGPGNSIQEPLNAADAIAEAHDISYAKAKKDSDVLQADKQAISEFAYEAVQGKDPVSRFQAAIGAVGLGIKHGVESLSGKVIYGKQCPVEKGLLVLLLKTVLIGIL